MAGSSREGSGSGRIDSERRPNLAGRRGEDLLIGRLIGHGAANYQFRMDEDPSYYVKFLTSRGPRTLWGKDLERALLESETRPKAGDIVGAHRPLWVVEKVGFFAARAPKAPSTG